MLTHDQIEDTLTAIDRELQLRQRVKERNVIENLTIKALEATGDRARRIADILAHKVYDIAFIGPIGTGKTTAICHLFGLTETLTVTRKRGKIDRQDLRTVELLQTGSGYTTICEVELQTNTSTKIIIEPYDTAEMTTLLNEFAAYIWSSVHKRGDEDIGTDSAPIELERAIRNIVDLPSQALDTEVDPERRIRVDRAKALAAQFAADQYDQFAAEMMQRAALGMRTQTESIYSDSAMSERTWVRTTFEEINLARRPDMAIPRKITVMLSPSILDTTTLPWLGRVIDTRGLATSSSRPDLENYIRDSDNTLCVFTDKFGGAPTGVSEVMRLYLTAETPDTVQKSVLMVIPRRGEPEKVVGSTGPTGDWEEGIALRKDHIERQLTDVRVVIDPKNVLFFDPLRFFRQDGFADSDYTADEISAGRQEILDALQIAYDQRIASLHHEFYTIQARFEAIIKGRGLDPEEEQAIERTKRLLLGFRHQSFLFDTLDNAYLREWWPDFASTLRAINNREGYYPPRDINIFEAGGYAVQRMIEQRAKAPKDKVLGILADLERNVADDSDLRPLVRAFSSQIDTFYRAFIDHIKKQAPQHLERGTFADEHFWQQVQQRWGSGSGFTLAVREMYMQQLNQSGMQKWLSDETEKAWSEQFVDRVLAFFGS